MKDEYCTNESFLEYYEKIGGSLNAYEKSREIKAKKIIAVLDEYCRNKNLNLKNLICLDIGCSTGLITCILSEKFKNIVGLDIDKKALRLAYTHCAKENLSFKEGSAMFLPFEDETFDVIICNHVYEHVPDCKRLFSEIYRVLKKGGFCYLAAGNKYKIIEPHYRLPFLSWFPKSLANIYLRIVKKGTAYEEKHHSFWEIKKILNIFKIADYTIEIIKFPEKYYATDIIKPDSMITKFSPVFLRLLEPIMPAFIFILEKD